MKRLMKYVKPFLLLTIVCLVLKQFASVMELQIPSALADIIDKAVPMARESGDTSTIIHYGLLMMVYAVAGAGTNLIANICSAYITAWTTRDIRQAMFVKINSLSARQLDARRMPRRDSPAELRKLGVHCSAGWRREGP